LKAFAFKAKPTANCLKTKNLQPNHHPTNERIPTIKIESCFRTHSQIEYGNTLTEIHFIEKKFDVAVANPPYGVDWKATEKTLRTIRLDDLLTYHLFQMGNFFLHNTFYTNRPMMA
jgi:hypothetical protein